MATWLSLITTWPPNILHKMLQCEFKQAQNLTTDDTFTFNDFVTLQLIGLRGSADVYQILTWLINNIL